MMDYQILWGSTIEELQKNVQAKISEGYSPIGGPSFDMDNLAHQAVIKDKTPERAPDRSQRKTIRGRTEEELRKNINTLIKAGWKTVGEISWREGTFYQEMER